MKKIIPVLKSLWFLLVVLLVMVGRELSFGWHLALTLMLLLAPLVREFVLNLDFDERQVYISHYSSHLAYFTYSVLLIFIVIKELLAQGQVTLVIFFLLLLIPMLVKIVVSLWQRYAARVKGLTGYLNLFFRGIIPSPSADERQHMVGNFSSHIAFYVFLTLTIAVILVQFIRKDQEPPTLWYMLLIVPLLSKLYSSYFLSFGAVRGSQFIGITIVGLFLIFILLSHGLSLGSLMESLPFLLILILMILANRFPRSAGIVLIVLAIGLGLFFYIKVWSRMDVYLCVLMFALIPIPVFLSGVALLMHRLIGGKND